MNDCILCATVEDRVLLRLPPCPECHGASREAAAARAATRSCVGCVAGCIAGCIAVAWCAWMLL